jgi:hypothetical protein
VSVSTALTKTTSDTFHLGLVRKRHTDRSLYPHASAIPTSHYGCLQHWSLIFLHDQRLTIVSLQGFEFKTKIGIPLVAEGELTTKTDMFVSENLCAFEAMIRVSTPFSKRPLLLVSDSGYCSGKPRKNSPARRLPLKM